MIKGYMCPMHAALYVTHFPGTLILTNKKKIPNLIGYLISYSKVFLDTCLVLSCIRPCKINTIYKHVMQY